MQASIDKYGSVHIDMTKDFPEVDDFMEMEFDIDVLDRWLENNRHAGIISFGENLVEAVKEVVNE